MNDSLLKWEYDMIYHRFEWHPFGGGYIASELWTLKNHKGKTAFEVISEKGKKGWELVSSTILPSTSVHNFDTLLFIFKRPLKE